MAKLKFTAPARTCKPKVPPAAPLADAIEAPPTKLAQITQLLRRPGGAGITELMAVTGWQAHSVRGALSGALKKKLQLNIISEKAEGGRVYRIPAEVAA